VRDHSELIIGLAARHRLPTVYYNRLFVEAGGLISYGASTIDPFRPRGELCRPYPQR
jgi:hypothetical protein